MRLKCLEQDLACRPEAALMYYADVPLLMSFTMRTKLIIISVLLVSCSEVSTPKLPSFTAHKIEINQGNMVTAEMRQKLKSGMTRLQVQAALGTPLVNDAFHANRWDYVYRLEKNGKLVEKQRMTLFFEGDRLTRIDDGNMPALPAVVAPASADPASENQPPQSTKE